MLPTQISISESNLCHSDPSFSIVANRFLSALLVLSFVGLCFSYQGDQDKNPIKQDPKERVLVKMAVQIPTPKDEEVVLILQSGDFAIVKMNQIATIPENEKFRTIVGEHASLSVVEKGETSGNNFWKVTKR